MSIVVVGAGVFGLSAALELRQRGHEVRLLDPGPLPRPAASSTDSSRAVRADYGSDEHYTVLAEAAFAGWDAWGARFGETLLHRDGFLFATRDAMQPGGFEYDSWSLLRSRGHELERLTPDGLGQRFPAWSTGRYRDGYFNPGAGWVHAAHVCECLLAEVRRLGVDVEEDARVASLVQRRGRVTGVLGVDGATRSAAEVVVCAGAWTPELLPWLRDVLQPVAQPVLYFGVDDLAAYRSPHFPTFGADIAVTGWYGFPANEDGCVKIANHGPGLRRSPDGDRTVPAEIELAARAFLRESLPRLAEAPLQDSKLCFYCDSFDGDFWIDRDPARSGLVVACGGSGHGFKFAPLLGELIANIVDGVPDPRRHRFAWRRPGPSRREQARRS